MAASAMTFWRVVGGQTSGGILVREGKDTASAKAAERLATGALVRELVLEGERLHFQLVDGGGPSTGWVSTVISGKELLVKAPRPQVPEALTVLPVLEPLPKSAWAAKYQHMPAARCRLFCSFGAGTDASTFAKWLDLALKYPSLELVLVQYPGRGSNRQTAVQEDAEELARLIEEALLNEPGKFALFGFSVGAVVMASLARRMAASGHTPVRLYVGGRAAPQITFKDPEEDMMTRPADYLKWFARSFVSPESAKVTDRIISSAEASDDDGILKIFRDTQCKDLVLGNSLGSLEPPLKIPCDIHVVASMSDRVWPATKSKEAGDLIHPPYDDIVSTWQTCAGGRVTSKIFDDVPHHDLCGGALLSVMCEDLQDALVSAALERG